MSLSLQIAFALDGEASYGWGMENAIHRQCMGGHWALIEEAGRHR